MTASSFVRRRINVTISIGLGTNGEQGFEVHKLPAGLRISAQITKAGGLTMGEAQVRIFGMTLDLMNRLSSMGLSPVRVRTNTILIEAGDDENGMAAVYQGDIQEAWQDFAGMPETSFVINAVAGQRAALAPATPTSFKGNADAAVIMAGLAVKAGLNFENNGVQGILLSNPYFPGSARSQILKCAEAADIGQTIDMGTLIIWPKGGSRNGTIALISKDSGLVGFPTLGAQNNLRVKVLFNRNIGFRQQIKVDSMIKPACGTWVVYYLSHTLESETVGGQWFTDLEASPVGAAPPVV